ncbi:uncharacterized protein LOC123682668 [Harmonia axyridis]|uniref:uncharacterized protein LOC123682668 n=1 Tax=Harmonia axyridis TaxID=115357 RepID=UPI001E276481|nr:uncharacterized protein LOC123682668 [Harmonia axyridis]XP_045477372.1 uncharacterized protein LOC123682668 [Harmonia axyridis]
MNASPSSSKSSTQRVTTTIQDELTWGIMYRNQNAKKNDIPLQLACSPLSIHQCTIDKVVKKTCIYPPPEEQPSRVKKRCAKKEICVNTKNLHAGQVDLLGRSVLNQKEYMDVLAVPNIRCFNKPVRRTRRRRRGRKYKCFVDRCSPRIIKLSIPRKHHVLGTWQEHQCFLPSEFIQRLHDLLHAENNITIKDVRYYFKKFDRRKRHLKMSLKRRRRKRDICDVMWTRCEVTNMANMIVNYFIEEPLLDLSFKQLFISSILINFMRRTGKIRQRLTRSTRRAFPTTIIEICDKLAVWLDSVVKLVDFQPIDDEELSEDIDDWGPGEEEGEEFFGMTQYEGDEDEEEEEEEDEDEIDEPK